MEVGALETLEASTSSWIKFVRVVAWIIKMQKMLLIRIKGEGSNIVANKHHQGRLTVSLLDVSKKEHHQMASTADIYRRN